jgi:hypothetical protein
MHMGDNELLNVQLGTTPQGRTSFVALPECTAPAPQLKVTATRRSPYRNALPLTACDNPRTRRNQAASNDIASSPPS